MTYGHRELFVPPVDDVAGKPLRVDYSIMNGMRLDFSKSRSKIAGRKRRFRKAGRARGTYYTILRNIRRRR
jgi:hypothetical protein